MPHIERDDLAVLALGERFPDESQAAQEHLASCQLCTRELRDLTDVARLGRTAEPAELLADPPPELWSSIVGELAGELTTPAGPTGPDAGSAGNSADVVPLDRARAGSGGGRRVRRFLPLLAAAAVGAVLAGGAMAAIGDANPDAPGGGAQQVVATAVLDPLTPTATKGTAVASEGPDGLEIRVDARGLPANDGFYEVWLLDEKATKLVALGALPAGSVGTFTVPPGVSLSDFPVVDISLEPYDGDPGHSHKSLLRGELAV